MKGKNPTAADVVFWNKLATFIGCIACRLDGIANHHVSIHHIDGRTKPGAHRKVLPLCGCHHQQDDTDPACRIAVHPYKKRFEKRYGRQMDLLDRCHAILASMGAAT